MKSESFIAIKANFRLVTDAETELLLEKVDLAVILMGDKWLLSVNNSINKKVST
jgi:hypothetical protein